MKGRGWTTELAGHMRDQLLQPKNDISYIYIYDFWYKTVWQRWASTGGEPWIQGELGRRLLPRRIPFSAQSQTRGNRPHIPPLPPWTGGGDPGLHLRDPTSEQHNRRSSRAGKTHDPGNDTKMMEAMWDGVETRALTGCLSTAAVQRVDCKHHRYRSLLQPSTGKYP
ncbi:Hypothetical predicted protein [Pelobates cultripes]|uniref:Uncharacterized protein n=1 Tax=Pelobates cultripes TaxID=61616 RepID=A0AAD1R127_PELCU|nr:Hypothetical predicted protein [Pelobates cultripes]